MAGGVWKSSRAIALMLAGAAVLAGPLSAQAQERERVDHDIADSGGRDREEGPRARGNRSWGANPAPHGAPPPREERAIEWRGRESPGQPQGSAPRWTPPAPQPQAEAPRWNPPVAQPPVQAALPQPPMRDAGPNRTYVDPARDRSYGADNRTQPPRQQGSPGQSLNGQNWNGTGNSAPDRNDERNGPRYRQGQGQGQWQGQWQGDRRPDTDRRTSDDRRWDNDRRWDSNRTPDWSSRRNSWSSRDDRDWSRQWRQDRRYNWQGWRNDHREIYRMGRYLPPYRSYSYRRLGIGILLDGGFFASRYWIDDPWTYRLPPVYGPYRWVRYYDDAVLVNIYSGEVVDVIYDVFW